MKKQGSLLLLRSLPSKALTIPSFFYILKSDFNTQRKLPHSFHCWLFLHCQICHGLLTSAKGTGS